MDHFKQLEFTIALLLEPVIIPWETGKEVLHLEKLFKSSLQSVTDKLNSDSDFEWLTAAVNGITLNGPYEDACWQFAEFSLKILLCFYNELKLVRENTCVTGQMALPPDTISIQQQKSIQSILKFIVCLGISRNLLPGVGIPLQHRSKFADILLNSDWKPSDYNKHQMLFSTVSSLMKCTGHSSLGSIIISQHFSDLLAAFCQLCFAPLKKEIPEATTQSQTNKYLQHLSEMSKDRFTCHKLLSMLLEKAFQPLLFHEILLLQGPPAFKLRDKDKDSIGKTPMWLKKATQKLFSERLMKKHGVQAGIQAILESFGENYTSKKWTKYDIAAHLIAECYPKDNADLFFQLVCPQILDLYDLKGKNLCHEFNRVATSVIRIMTGSHPTLSEKHLINPMMKSLLVCSSKQEIIPRLPSEEEIASCITKIHQVFVITSDPEERFIYILSPVIGILLHITTFLNSGVSFLRHFCEELICQYLKYVNVKIAISTLTEWLFTFDGNSKMIMWNSKLSLKNGTSGGITVHETEFTENSDDCCWLEDDYKVAVIIALLSKLHDNRIVMVFFLSILQDLTYVIQERMPSENDCYHHNQSKELKNIETKRVKEQYHARKSVIIVEILSALCAQPALQDAIMKDQSLVINFVKLTLERSVHLIKCPADNIMETETVTMALTILSVIASDQNSEETKESLKLCLPLVETLAAHHPEDSVQQYARQLYISIMTHGVVNVEKPSCSTALHGLASMNNLRKQEKDKIETTQISEQVTVNDDDSGVTSKYKEACEIVFDPEPAVKGHGLLALRKLIASRDEETIKHKEKVLTIFMKNLEHEDSYVYLMAISGLASLADLFPEVVLPCLMSQYSQGGPTSSPELRMKLGEVLIKVTKALGEIITAYREPLLCVFLQTTKDSDPFVRASSLSNLGEVCKALKYSLGSYVHQVFNCITSFIKSDSSAEVRRAAIDVITSIFQGLEKDSFQVLDYILKDIYRLLKLASEIDKDEGVKFHAQIALAELQKICLDNLFPHQTLEKKIKVLDPV